MSNPDRSNGSATGPLGQQGKVKNQFSKGLPVSYTHLKPKAQFPAAICRGGVGDKDTGKHHHSRPELLQVANNSMFVRLDVYKRQTATSLYYVTDHQQAGRYL